MDGFLLAFKEKGISSNQVVQQTKRLFSLKKVGHLGTLDPMAEGLLVLAVNRATRFSSFFLESDKKYEAEVSFGAKTNTDDAMGEVIESSSYLPKETDIKQELNKFLGESLQNPPYFSALKHKGKPLYKYAREGVLISKPPREINIYSIKNINLHNNICVCDIHCSKGTYIRSIARDLGELLDCGGHLSALKRLTQQEFLVNDAKKIDEITELDIIPLEQAFSHLGSVNLPEEKLKKFINGSTVDLGLSERGLLRAYNAEGVFIALGRNSSEGFKHEYLV